MAGQIANDLAALSNLLNPLDQYGSISFGSNNTNLGILGSDLAQAIELIAGGGTSGAGLVVVLASSLVAGCEGSRE